MSSLQTARSDIKPVAAELLAARLREREFVAYGLPLNLRVLGFIEERNHQALAIFLLHLGALPALLPKELRPLKLLAVSMIFLGAYFSLRCLNPRWKWVNADGSNRHWFAVRAERVRWRNLFMKTPKDTSPWDDYLQRPIRDPNVGMLQCDFRFADSIAESEHEVVFRIQRKPDRVPKGVPGDSLERWHGLNRVLADPRLHPDTVEALVERYAIRSNEWAKRNFLINLNPGQKS